MPDKTQTRLKACFHATQGRDKGDVAVAPGVSFMADKLLASCEWAILASVGFASNSELSASNKSSGQGLFQVQHA
jgi:hypothetical protein